MAQTSDQVDPNFVTALRTKISGIYFSQVAHYQPAEIEREFHKAAQDSTLVEDTDFMANLFYLVRMNEVRTLRDDVWRLVAGQQLKPVAQVSGLKTVFALGSPNDRQEVDRMEAAVLTELGRQGGSPAESPFVPAADRIGGTRTLIALQSLLNGAAAQQAAVTRDQPDNFSLIARLDKIRAGLQRQVIDLSRKTGILSKPEPERTAELTRVYMNRPAFLSCWAYRELVDNSSPASQAAVAEVVTREIPTFLPIGGQSPETRSQEELDLRLRGIALLQQMGSTLTADEAELLKKNDAIVKARRPFFYPACTWEDVLDVI